VGQERTGAILVRTEIVVEAELTFVAAFRVVDPEVALTGIDHDIEKAPDPFALNEPAVAPAN
jgi:hypothetical protein